MESYTDKITKEVVEHLTELVISRGLRSVRVGEIVINNSEENLALMLVREQEKIDKTAPKKPVVAEPKNDDPDDPYNAAEDLLYGSS
jgi:hypothetical protein